jgi:redox-sensitive bicupin YhaK (pirin superfamily)
MITYRPAAERGQTKIDWLDSRHTFSFGDYYDPTNVGFRVLRVINDDRVAPGAGFPTHGHADMEIISYVLSGALAHKDSLGTGSVIRPGDVQRMTAGTGVRHSEHNASRDEAVHFLQIWIIPERRGLPPSYEQKQYPDPEKRGVLKLVASPDGRDGSITIHQDASLYAGLLAKGERATHRLSTSRAAWVHVARGEVEVGGRLLHEGDGAAVLDAPGGALDLVGVGDGDSQLGEVLVFDLP